MTVKPDPEYILIRMPNWLGDCVMALPVLEAIQKKYPSVKIDIAINENLAGLSELADAVENTIPLSKNDPAKRKEAFRKIKNNGYDAALILPNSFRSAWEIWRAKVPERIGYSGEFRSILLTRSLPRPKKHSMSQRKYYESLASAAFPGIIVKPLELKAPKPEGELANILELSHDKPLIGIGFGATYGDAKMWPAKRFAELIDRLETKAKVVLLGADSDREVEKEVLSHAKSTPISLVGRTDLAQLAAVLSRLKLYITNDTGPMHLATALGTRVIALFGPTSPDETGPEGDNVTVIYHGADCAPCWKRKCPVDHRCMTAITVDEVLKAVSTNIVLA